MERVKDVAWALVVILGYLAGVFPAMVCGAHKAGLRWTRECFITMRWHLIGAAGRERLYQEDMARLRAKFPPPRTVAMKDEP